MSKRFGDLYDKPSREESHAAALLERGLGETFSREIALPGPNLSEVILPPGSSFAELARGEAVVDSEAYGTGDVEEMRIVSEPGNVLREVPYRLEAIQRVIFGPGGAGRGRGGR